MIRAGRTGLVFAAGGISALLVAAAALYVAGLWPRPPAPASAVTSASGTSASGTSASGEARAVVAIPAAQARAAGLALSPASRRALVEHWSVPATVVPDESRISHIHTRVSGWIERLYVSNTGEPVRAGQPVAAIFSQELFASQLDYLTARGFTGPASVVADSGRARLKFFGMSESDILAIERAGQPRRLVTLHAPRSGILAHRGIAPGTAVDPSTEIAIVVDLSQVWVVADVPAAAAGQVKAGMAARITFGSGGPEAVAAKVQFIDPTLTEQTRTLKVRFSLPNPAGQLRPGMIATAELSAPPRVALTVPRDALVDTGDAQYVYVASGASYVPRRVRIGARLPDAVEILDGLREGEPVVASGVFLLDSESRLAASGPDPGAHGGHGAAPAAPAAPVATARPRAQHGTAHD